MVKPISQQLADLSVRAKAAEDSATAMKLAAEDKMNETDEQLNAIFDARQEQIKTSSANRKASFDQHVSSAEENVNSAWTGLSSKVQSDVSGIRTKIDFKKHQHDKNKANDAADTAEESAARAIGFALDAIDYAESAVLDAVLARAYAESV